VGLFAKEEALVITIGLAMEHSGCFKPSTIVFAQQDRRMVLTGKDTPDRTDQQVVLGALWVVLM
jgi:hypothetical protein